MAKIVGLSKLVSIWLVIISGSVKSSDIDITMGDSDRAISGHPRDLGIFSMLGINYGSGCRPPSDFPSTIPLSREVFKDPLKKLRHRWMWKVTPKSPTQVVILTNWAQMNGYNLQSLDLLSPSAIVSSPLLSIRSTTTSSTDSSALDCTKVLLIDRSKSLVKMKLVGKNLVTVQTGVKMSDLLQYLENHGLGLPISPIPGQDTYTVGEAIAIGAYGIGVHSHREKSIPFGSVSSLVMSFKAVAWDRALETYTLKKLDRPDPRSLAFLTNLGRSYLTEVTLLVQPSYQLRCQTFSEFSSENLFASPNSTFSLVEESFAYLVEEYGKVEVSYFPYVDRSWVKVWSKEVKRPLGSMKITKQQNLSNSPVSNFLSRLSSNVMSFAPSFSPSMSKFLFDIGVFRMRLTGENDIWGTSHETLFTLTNDTAQVVTSRGYVVITKRSDIQQVVHDFHLHFVMLRDRYKQNGKYPANRPLKIRIANVDSASSLRESAQLIPPALSVLSPVKSQPEFDTAVIFELEFSPSDPACEEFINEMEPWIYANYQGDYARIRPLWSTEWAHDRGNPNSYDRDFKDLVKNSYGSAWSKTIKVLDFYDPHKIFRNPIFEAFLRNEFDPEIL